MGNAIRLFAGMIGRSIGPSFLAAGDSTLFVIIMLPLFLLIGYWLWNKANTETDSVYE